MSDVIERNELIIAAQTGDPVALERLLRACRPDVRRYAHRQCHANNVDDAIQETLFIVSRRIHSLKVAAAFSSWLFIIIKRECQKLFSAFQKHEVLDEENSEDLFAHKTDEALQIDLISALESLPSHYLKIILLRDFEELTIAEISSKLGENSGAIKSRLHRARELVREYLQDC